MYFTLLSVNIISFLSVIYKYFYVCLLSDLEDPIWAIMVDYEMNTSE
jgi:hypothetical protein